MTALGAYGFALRFAAPDPADLADLLPVGAGRPVVDVRSAIASAVHDEEVVEAERVVLGWRSGGRLEVLRDPPAAVLHLPEPQTGGALVHPSLTIPMAVLARWRGDHTLHAGAFEAHGRAWAVVGDRRAGKSTTLAALARAGRPVVADDLLVVGGDGVVWPGPRCVDLRPDAAERVPGARFVAHVGGRPRWRLSSPPAPERLPLGGFFLLGWAAGDAPAIEPLPASALLPALYGQDYIAVLGPPPAELVLDLLERPAWRVTRPRAWRVERPTVDALLATVASAVREDDQARVAQ